MPICLLFLVFERYAHMLIGVCYYIRYKMNGYISLYLSVGTRKRGGVRDLEVWYMTVAHRQTWCFAGCESEREREREGVRDLEVWYITLAL